MKIRYNAPIILTYTLFCIGVLFVDTLTGHQITRRFFMVYSFPVLSDPVQYFRMFSYIIGHANWSHLAGNFSIILLIGPLLEEKYGSAKLFEMIIFTAVITALLNMILFHSGLLGASGIAFMLILLGSFSNIRAGEIPLTFMIVAALFLGNEVFKSLNSDNISQFSHIIGGIVGAIYGFLRR
ncbi:MAG: rhomboid family intramembrane serine protease [Deltaproteobacteria bacterium]|nr:rhomboid family intramembrane serine protease [Deltaproteobacteria bacterium]